jgi:hypothetical protein
MTDPDALLADPALFFGWDDNPSGYNAPSTRPWTPPPPPPPPIYYPPPVYYPPSPTYYPPSPPPFYSAPRHDPPRWDPPPPPPPPVPLQPDGPGDVVYRLFDRPRSNHLFTTNRDEAVGARNFHFESFAFIAPDAGPDTLPVFRLSDPRTGHLLLTINPAERDAALSGAHPMRLDGVAFHARAADTGPDIAVYRLRDIRDGSWLFTTSEAERAALIGQGRMADEGIAFYAL